MPWPRLETKTSRSKPGEVLVERKIVPAARDRSAPLGLIVLLAFIVTCVVVFFGDRLGIRAIGPWTMVEVVPN